MYINLLYVFIYELYNIKSNIKFINQSDIIEIYPY